MKTASDFRAIARNVLQGKWIMAVLIGLAASLLGGEGTNGPEATISYEGGNADLNLKFAGQTIYSTGGSADSELTALFAGGVLYIILIVLVLAVLYFILGSFVEVGYARVNLNLLEYRDPSFDTLFAYFPYWKTTAVASILRGLYILLWSVLLIIPGIVASYSYRMTPYILAENPNLPPAEAIHRSRQLMYGNRWRLFCLDFSFIGWELVCALTLGLGNLALRPYTHAATAAFYRDLVQPAA